MRSKTGAFWLLVLAGLLARVAVVLLDPYSADLDNEWLVHLALGDGLKAYTFLNPDGCTEVVVPVGGKTICHWSYPPGYWPMIQFAALFGRDTFDTLVRLLPYAADIALAWMVRRRLAAPALILLSPAFIIAGADYAQVESIAVLPAVWAVTRSRSDRDQGLLVGVAVSLKTAMLMFLAARWPVESQRSRVRVAAFAFAVLAALMIPFALSDHHALNGLVYHGLPGGGGLSLILQPSLARVGTEPLHMSELSVFVFHYGAVVTVAAMGAAAVWAVAKRVSPEQTAVLLVLTLAVFGFSWQPTYMIWGIPFFLLCGYVRATVVLQILMLPALLFAIPAFNAWAPKLIYVASMGAVWAFMAAWLGFLVLPKSGQPEVTRSSTSPRRRLRCRSR